MDIGFWELFVVGVVALAVFGPEQLPDLARKVGRMGAKAKTMWRSFTDELQDTHET